MVLSAGRGHRRSIPERFIVSSPLLPLSPQLLQQVIISGQNSLHTWCMAEKRKGLPCPGCGTRVVSLHASEDLLAK